MLTDGVGVIDDVTLGVGVIVGVVVCVGVGVGVGVQQLQLSKFPVKFQIGGALHWQTCLMPVITRPLAQDRVIEDVHLLVHELGPLYLIPLSHVIVELYESPHGKVPLTVHTKLLVFVYVTGIIRLLHSAPN